MVLPQRENGITFREIARSDLVGQVAGQLYAAITEGRLKPGARVVEAAVAREMGVSRAPVREAARLLEQRGLLVASPGRGFTVRCPTVGELDDIYGLRINLETYAANLVIERAEEADLARLTQQLERLRATAAEGDVARTVEEDLRFHLLICELSGNRRLLRVFTDLADEIRLIIALIEQIFDDPQRLADAHIPLLDALQARDKERIAREMDWHIGVAWEQLRRRYDDAGQTAAGDEVTDAGA
ncbi:GntR family transcriptional regulator [Fodinicurvata halophila]|uniref:GntR family transcriptional regulator n=1 Tax=Fodinicurvata halophila TaxID=1419723 RepID=A0ABV8UP60_9PROT